MVDPTKRNKSRFPDSFENLEELTILSLYSSWEKELGMCNCSGLALGCALVVSSLSILCCVPSGL